MIDRRAFSKGLLFAAAGAATTKPGGAAEAAEPKVALACTVVIDARTGIILHREGPCERRFSPFSTFKLPLAIMGFDAGILKDPHHPRWDYKPEFKASAEREKKSVDPTIWLSDSILWYSRETTRKLGMDRFQSYVRQFGYGNQDTAGSPGENDSLTRSWLMSSLQISPDEQALFIKRLLDRQLGVSDHAYEMTHATVTVFSADGGWTVHGKTGSGWLANNAGAVDKSRPQGWFVGWAEKGDRLLAFARLRVGGAASDKPNGMIARAEVLEGLAGWAGG